MKNNIKIIIAVVFGISFISFGSILGYKYFSNNKSVDSDSVLGEEAKEETPEQTPTPIIIPTDVIEQSSISKPISTPTPTQAPPAVQSHTTDSALKIEICKTEAEKHKTLVMESLVLVYNQNNADAVKIANTSSVEELVDVGISIGLITREQYNSDPNGHQLTLLKLRKKVMAEINTFMATVNGKGDLAYNEHYANCLNN